MEESATGERDLHDDATTRRVKNGITAKGTKGAKGDDTTTRRRDGQRGVFRVMVWGESGGSGRGWARTPWVFFGTETLGKL